MHKHSQRTVLVLGLGSLLAACSETAQLPVDAGMGPNPELPEPKRSLLPTVHIAEAEGWAPDEGPSAAQGLQVQAFATRLLHPRWLYTLPNGDVLVAETNAPQDSGKGGITGWVMSKVMAKAGAGVPSPDRITLLRDTDGDGVADHQRIFLDGLHSPFGMALVGDRFYVANADALMEFPYREGADHIEGPGRKLTDLPSGINHHWTKSLLASPDGTKLYVGVGSNSNVAEGGMEIEQGRAAIWEIDRASGASRLYAEGLRNPVGLTWVGSTLWVSVNERDEIGGDLVPDYMTSVQDGGFYGWPYSYYGQHVDERVEPQRPDLVAKAIKPDYALGPHTASLGLLYSEGNALPAEYDGGMFIGQHGSWNRKPRSGYQVLFVEFDDGTPVGLPRPVLTGFLEDDVARGRPVGLTLANDGSLLVADDVGNVVWRVSSAESERVSALP